jgi:hypothetical protein
MVFKKAPYIALVTGLDIRLPGGCYGKPPYTVNPVHYTPINNQTNIKPTIKVVSILVRLSSGKMSCI